MKKNEICEGAATVDKAVGTAKDVAGTVSLPATIAAYAPKIPGAIKAIGKRALPGANAAYQGLDAAKRFTAGDPIGGMIATASVHPALAIPGAAVQAVRDKINTGSFMPDDEEVAAAGKKSQQYWKDTASKFDPSYMPESKVMKSNRLHAAIVKEELALKKCSLSEEDLRNTLFIYKDKRGNIFTESGRQIDLNRLDEAPAWLKPIGQGLQTGWNAIRAGGEWAAKNIPPAYQKGKELIGKGAEEVGNLYQAGKKVGTAIGNELVDVPTSAAKKLKGAYQDIRYGTTPGMDPAQRLDQIAKHKSTQSMADLDAAAVQREKGLAKQDVNLRAADVKVRKAEADAIKQQAKAAAEKDLATARDIEAKRPVDWKSVGKKTVAGTAIAGAGTDVAKGVDVSQDAAGNVTGVDYEPGRGLKRAMGIDEETTTSLWDYMFGKKKPAPAPEVKPPAPEVKPPAPEVKPPEPAAVIPGTLEPRKPAPDAAAQQIARNASNTEAPPADGTTVSDTPRRQANSGSDKVRAMQQKLKAAGYDLGNFGPEGNGIDGKWGKKTQAAYDAYKADQKLKQAGEPDAASRERERIAAQSNANQARQGSDTTVRGDQIDVKDLQKDYPKVTQNVPSKDAAKEIPPGDQFSQNIAFANRQSAEKAAQNKVPYEIDTKATAARDSLKNYEPYIPIKQSSDPIGDTIKQKQAEKVIPESVNTELQDILWLAGKTRK